jgi:hypothetical protein
MKKTTLILIAVAVLFITGCSKKSAPQADYTPPVTSPPITVTPPATSPNGDVVGKLVVGYQGWFSAKGDGSPSNSWNHQNIEMWPDTREYTATYTGSPFDQNGVQQPPFTGNLGNGQPAVMFSSYDQSTVNTHFLWMQQNGIDCAALQRFGSELDNTTLKAQRDGMAVRVRHAAETYGVKYYIMYDISGWTNFQTEIKSDWTSYMSANTASSAYAMQNGKPVVCIWGVGFSDRPGNVTSWTDVLNWFKSQGCYVIVGTPANFSTDLTNRQAYSAANMIMPWRVGNLGDFPTEDTQDINYCNAVGIDYQVDIYPGTAFANTNGSVKSPQNQIPRLKGNFMWSQFAAAKNASVKSVYISMFDEINEATSIFKCAEDATMIPAGEYFLTLDADGTHLSSDFYLRLTNDGAKMIKGTTPYQATLPTAPQ